MTKSAKQTILTIAIPFFVSQIPNLTHCCYCKHEPERRGGGYLLEGGTSIICKECHSERFLHCRKCKRHIFDTRLIVKAVGYSWHVSCLKCCVSHCNMQTCVSLFTLICICKVVLLVSEGF